MVDLIRTQIYVDNFIESYHRYRIIQSPIFVTYLSLDLQKSTIQEGMFQGSTYQPIGPYSSLKYNVIYRWPLSKVSPTYSRSSQGTEFGINVDTELECLFISFEECGLVPSLHDLCVLEYYSGESPERRQFLPIWAVANIERVPLHVTNTVWKLKLVSSGFLLKHLLAAWNKQIVNEYVFDEHTKRLYLASDYTMLSSLRVAILTSLQTYEKHLGIPNTVSSLKISSVSI